MTNQDIQKAPINDQMKRALKALRQAPVFHNIMDLVPSACTWNIPIDNMETYVLTTAQEWLGKEEVKMVTIDPALKGRRPVAYVWLRKDSRHLVDASKSKNTNLVISPKVERFSDELKKFADQFAPTEREDGTPISRKKRIDIRENERGDKSIVAVSVDINRILYRIFDVDNRGFLDMFGADATSRKCSLDCVCRYSKRGTNERELSYIIVTKRFDGGMRKFDRPKARNSFRDSRREDEE